MRHCILLGILFVGGKGALSAGTEFQLVWPTPNPAWLEGRPPEAYVQPAASGRTESALFGCTRTGGTRFHEGVDLKPLRRDARGEPLDAVYAVMEGRVAYVNPTPWHSSYGRYVVIEHTETEPSAISLYAHLGSIDPAVSEGERVSAGQTLGIMGRSAGGYTIPVHQAHVHFEIGFWISEEFQAWYDRQDYETPNRHGLFNGFNMIGFDPIDFYDQYRRGRAGSILEYLEAQPVAYTLRVADSRVPDFVRRYPQLLEGELPGNGPAGWEIDFTWYGLPLRWRTLTEVPGGERIEVAAFDREWLERNTCRPTVRLVNGEPRIQAHTERVLELLFDAP